MKLTFNGDSLSEIHQQIIAAADELTREDVSIKEPIKYPTLADVAKQKVPKELVEAVFGDVPDLGIKYTETPAQPEQQAVNPTHIDGHVISDGRVWVPVEGRGSAFTGVDMDKYLVQKAAKESGGELDAAGTPYNPAIHTSTRTKTTKGLWKNRPGGGAAKIETAPVEQPAQAQWQPATTEASKPATVQEVVAHEDSVPAIGRAPSMHSYESFKTNLMTIIVKLINENKITRDYMKDLNTYFEVPNLWDVKNDDNKCQQLFKLFLEYQFIMGA